MIDRLERSGLKHKTSNWWYTNPITNKFPNRTKKIAAQEKIISRFNIATTAYIKLWIKMNDDSSDQTRPIASARRATTPDLIIIGASIFFNVASKGVNIYNKIWKFNRHPVNALEFLVFRFNSEHLCEFEQNIKVSII